MTDSIELERIYLIKALPDGMEDCERKEIIDIYIPKSAQHHILRIRKNGSKYEMTKKEPVKGADSSKQLEQTIPLTEEEFQDMNAIEGKRIRKVRYLYDYRGRTAEIDIFKDALEGLVLVDFEFGSEADKDAFDMPDFCLADVTQEEFVAGGMLCGKKYADIRDMLSRFGYEKIRQ